MKNTFRIKKKFNYHEWNETIHVLLGFSFWNHENNFNESWLSCATGTLLTAEDSAAAQCTPTLRTHQHSSILLAKFVLP